MSASRQSGPGVEPATFDTTSLQTLRASLRGTAFVPGDEGYDAARQTWNAKTFEQRPAIVVMPATAIDVVTAVNFAREHDLPVAVQGGGHGHPRPADGALLVNFANMARVRIDADAATAQVEAGAKWSDVIPAAHAHGLAPLNGFAPTVGVAGYLLGGGIGWLTRQYGAAAASLRSAELVTADGALLQVSEDTHPDLLWGLRGGGGNFGVVTTLEFALYPVKEIFGGQILYPLAAARDILPAYVRWARTAPEQLTSAVRLTHFPPAPVIPAPLRGQSVIAILACFNGAASDGEALMQPMRSLGTPILDTFAPMPYARVAEIANDPPEPAPVLTYIDSGAYRDLAEAGLDALLRIAGDRASGIFLAEIRHLGGALARHPEDSMPFTLRQTTWLMTALAAAPAPEGLDTGKRSIAALLEEMKPGATGEAMVNAIDPADASPERTRAAYTPENYRRLVALKDRYDPANVFRFNYNVPPSA